MAARRKRAKVVKLPKRPAGVVGGFTEEQLEAHGLASVVWMIACGLDVNTDSDRVSAALSHVERSLLRLSDALSPDAQREKGVA